MIIQLKPSIEKIEKTYDNENAKKLANEFFEPLMEFNIPTYHANTHNFTFLCENYPYKSHPNMVDYFYGLDITSLEKHINTEYGNDNPNAYIVEAYLLSMENEKYYKHGTFVDLNGKNTEQDFYAVDDWETLADKAQFKDNWIAVSIHKCN